MRFKKSGSCNLKKLDKNKKKLEGKSKLQRINHYSNFPLLLQQNLLLRFPKHKSTFLLIEENQVQEGNDLFKIKILVHWDKVYSERQGWP